jgi:hypothetical protein
MVNFVAPDGAKMEGHPLVPTYHLPQKGMSTLALKHLCNWLSYELYNFVFATATTEESEDLNFDSKCAENMTLVPSQNAVVVRTCGKGLGDHDFLGFAGQVSPIRSCSSSLPLVNVSFAAVLSDDSGALPSQSEMSDNCFTLWINGDKHKSVANDPCIVPAWLVRIGKDKKTTMELMHVMHSLTIPEHVTSVLVKSGVDITKIQRKIKVRVPGLRAKDGCVGKPGMELVRETSVLDKKIEKPTASSVPLDMMSLIGPHAALGVSAAAKTAGAGAAAKKVASGAKHLVT